MPAYLKSLCLLLALGLLVSACSKAGLAYRNLDWVISWRVNQYLDLDSQQKAWFKPKLQEHLTWHCSTELPRYVDWLQRTQDLVQQPAPMWTGCSAPRTWFSSLRRMPANWRPR